MEEFRHKTMGNPCHFLEFRIFALFGLAYAKWRRNQGPEPPKSSPGGSEIVPGGSKIDPGSSKIGENLTFRNLSRNFARKFPDFRGQETEKGAQNRKMGSVLEAEKGSEIDFPEIFAKLRIFRVFEGECRKTLGKTRFRTLKSGKFTFRRHRKTRGKIAAGKRE